MQQNSDVTFSGLKKCCVVGESYTFFSVFLRVKLMIPVCCRRAVRIFVTLPTTFENIRRTFLFYYVISYGVA